jgi:hypothetical protein
MSQAPAETLDVPEVRQLPELSANEEDPVAFADMVLTILFGYENALLYAESNSADPNASFSWRIKLRNEAVPTHDMEVAISPSRGNFRSVLARFGYHYMGVQLYGGYALRLLRQGGRTRSCHIFMSNQGASGFWIRIYSASVQPAS